MILEHDHLRSLMKEDLMLKGEQLVIIGCGGVGAPAAMLSKKLMPEVDVVVIREEREFIVR
jgi:D-arabinose 1-dehydrogenase-like Zn-dependent alcohol dehydrogenase